MSYERVLFDFDGTLADSFPWLQTVIHQVAEKYRVKVPETYDERYLRSLSARQMIGYLGPSFWKIPLLANEMRRLARAHADQIPLFPGVDQLLQGLHGQGVQLAVVSSNALENVLHILGPSNAALIQAYECNVSIFGKAARIRKLLRQSAIPAANTILIGDELRDLQAARKAGIAFGAVAWGYTLIEAFYPHQPEEVFLSMEDLLAYRFL